MLHGYHHDEPGGKREFIDGSDLVRKVRDGRRYLEDLLHTRIRVFVPPHNAIGRSGLRAIVREGLHLGGVAGLRNGWSCFAPSSLRAWWRIRKWRLKGGRGVPWVVSLGDHREISGNAITPSSTLQDIEARFDCARELRGVFCLATHYWEFDVPCKAPNTGTVRSHLHRIINRAKSDPQVVWCSVGDVLTS
jgi:hypothetical protein